MKAHYSNLRNITRDSEDDPRYRDPVLLDHNRSGDETAIAQKASFGAWMSTLWSLAAHCTLSVGVTVLVLVYIDGRYFNVTQRFPLVQAVGGTRVAPFSPTQSDIVTVLSSIIVVLRCALVAWTAPLGWRIALFLMERRGIAHRDLKTLLDYGLLAPNIYSRDFSIVIISALLLASLAANLSSPLLTGSITWIPTSQLAYSLSIDSVLFDDIGASSLTAVPDYYRDNDYERDLTVGNSAGVINIGWGRDTEKRVHKRVSDSVEVLAINSTIENVTLPYFEVHSLRWIEDASEIPTVESNGTTLILKAVSDSAPAQVSGYPFGYALLVPNSTTFWANDTMNPTIIRDTRLMVLYYGIDQQGGIQTVTQSLPPNTYQLYQDRRYYAFVWVTFSAGVGRCKGYQCVVSSPSTIRNNTAIELEPHPLTFQALSIAPVVALSLVAQNASIPSSWVNLDDYLEAILVRSYSGAWNSLNSNMARILRVTSASNYIPSFPGLVAQVDRTRAIIWLSIQLLVTLLSIIFLIIQTSLSRYPLIGDTTFTSFNLDTTEVPISKTEMSNRARVLKVEPQDGRLKVKIE